MYLPVDGARVVDRIYTDLAVIDITPTGFRPSNSPRAFLFEHVQAMTGGSVVSTSGIPLRVILT